MGGKGYERSFGNSGNCLFVWGLEVLGGISQYQFHAEPVGLDDFLARDVGESFLSAELP